MHGSLVPIRYGFTEDYGPMAPMDAVVAQPAVVRRVACQALVENELGRRWLEPMINLEPVDLQELLNDGTNRHLGPELYYGVTIVRDTTLEAVTGGGLASRTMLADDWLAAMRSLKPYRSGVHDGVQQRNSLWTHILEAETRPREFGFKEYRQDE